MDSKLRKQVSFSSNEVDRVKEKLDVVRSTPDLRIEKIGLDHDSYEKLRSLGLKTVKDLASELHNLKIA